LFDLDGTLTDPKIGITKSVQYSLKAFGINIDNPDELIHFIGPPLRDSYKIYHSFSDDEAEKAVEKYREYFSETGIFENSIYDGIERLLQMQYAMKKTLAVATSKPTVYAEKILRHFHIDQYFSFVSGSELDGTRSQKELVIRHALDNLKAVSVQEAVMIGDREHDILGAKKLGMDSIGVLYGYGTYEELSSVAADYIVHSVDKLSALLAAGCA
jgi:phosphoglycolate phosphatase